MGGGEGKWRIAYDKSIIFYLMRLTEVCTHDREKTGRREGRSEGDEGGRGKENEQIMQIFCLPTDEPLKAERRLR